MDPLLTGPHADTGLLMLADISGYTSFLGKVSTEHPEMVQPGATVPPAYVVMSSLLDVVVDRIAPAFHLCEIEGDAVFAYSADEPRTVGDGDDLMGIIRSAYAGFRQQIDAAMVVHKHECQACFLLPSLELKYVVHHGSFVIQPIAGQKKLLGPTVNVAHRLLKNSVTERTGLRAYALITDAAAAHVGFRTETALAHTENYTDVGTVAGRVIGLN